jgi:hypothetical protein
MSELPRLLSKKRIRDEFFGGLGRYEVDRLFQVLDVVSLPGSGKLYVERDALLEYIDAHREAGVA